VKWFWLLLVLSPGGGAGRGKYKGGGGWFMTWGLGTREAGGERGDCKIWVYHADPGLHLQVEQVGAAIRHDHQGLAFLRQLGGRHYTKTFVSEKSSGPTSHEFGWGWGGGLAVGVEGRRSATGHYGNSGIQPIFILFRAQRDR